MDTIPQEILDEIFICLGHPAICATERLELIPSLSRKAILAVRLVCKDFERSSRDLFVKVLEETAFTWTSNSLAKLGGLSRDSLYAPLITTFTFSRLPFGSNSSTPDIDDAERLSEYLRRFPNLEHVVYHRLPPLSITIQPVVDSDGHEETLHFVNAINDTKLELKSFKTSLVGNMRGSAMGAEHLSCLPSLSTLQLNLLTPDFLSIAARNLRKLDMVFRSPPGRALNSIPQMLISACPFTSLEDYRMILNAPHHAHFPDARSFLESVPNLKRIALGYVTLQDCGSWELFLQLLQPRFMESVWLINPDAILEPSTPSVPFIVDESFTDVAKDFRVLYTSESNWDIFQHIRSDAVVACPAWSVFEHEHFEGSEKYVQVNKYTLCGKDKGIRTQIRRWNID